MCCIKTIKDLCVIRSTHLRRACLSLEVNWSLCIGGHARSTSGNRNCALNQIGREKRKFCVCVCVWRIWNVRRIDDDDKETRAEIHYCGLYFVHRISSTSSEIRHCRDARKARVMWLFRENKLASRNLRRRLRRRFPRKRNHKRVARTKARISSIMENSWEREKKRACGVEFFERMHTQLFRISGMCQHQSVMITAVLFFVI